MDLYDMHRRDTNVPIERQRWRDMADLVAVGQGPPTSTSPEVTGRGSCGRLVVVDPIVVVVERVVDMVCDVEVNVAPNCC